MARLRYDHALSLLAVVAVVWAASALAVEAPTGLYDRPVLVLDPGMHTAPIARADADAAGRYAVTGSVDKTVRVWTLTDGRLERTIRLPAGPGNTGKVHAVAISPTGDLIAAGGWIAPALPQHIYLFNRATGGMTGRIDGLPNVVIHLTFSPDGRYLAATLGGANGLRVYDREARWVQVARDMEYGDSSYGAAFAPDGRLATTSLDGKVRLYNRTFDRVATMQTTGVLWPYGIAFHPRGATLAIGYSDRPKVVLLDGHTLAPLSLPDTSGINNGNLSKVAWSADGAILFASGRYQRAGIFPVIAWAAAGTGARGELPASTNTIMTLAPLADGALLVVAGDPSLAVLDPTGGARWVHRWPQTDFRGQYNVLAVSFDGQMVDFGHEIWGKAPARFDVAQGTLTVDPAHDGRTAPPTQDGVPVSGWKDTTTPMLAGQPLRLHPYEKSHSFAIHPDGQRFILGTDWSLRAFDTKGEALWRQAVPGGAWAVTISGDGRLVVAAYSDGTIRWHRMDDGQELLAFFPLADRKHWVSWTPEGVYAATPDARRVLRWHVNRGVDAAGEAIPVSDIPGQFRPDVLPLVLQELDEVTALGLAERANIRRAVQLRTNSAIPPGTQLHVLAIGVGEYKEAHARHLRLEFAAADAHDVAAALHNTQQSLYARVNPQTLRNSEATRAGIFRALDTLYKGMQPDDVAVVHFSGHGAMVDGALYLLPYEVDTRDGATIKASAIEISTLRAELLRLAERGRVLVLLDACRSGAATVDGANITFDARMLRAALATTNVTVLTSSSGTENSLEHAAWKNGAFTEVFLEALGREADTDRNGVISMTELTRYLTAGVPRLVQQVRPEWHQTPGVEVRFEHTIFAAGP